MPFPEVKLIDKLLAQIDVLIWKIDYGVGFCTECHKWTWDLHDSSSQGYHCEKCCDLE